MNSAGVIWPVLRKVDVWVMGAHLSRRESRAEWSTFIAGDGGGS